VQPLAQVDLQHLHKVIQAATQELAQELILAAVAVAQEQLALLVLMQQAAVLVESVYQMQSQVVQLLESVRMLQEFIIFQAVAVADLTLALALVVLEADQQDLTLRHQMQPLTQAEVLVDHLIMQALQAALELL
jgi:amino acid permease